MTARRYLQLDVFADRRGAGNPLGVILDSDGLDSDAMQALAAWLNLSETIFFLPVAAGGVGAGTGQAVTGPAVTEPAVTKQYHVRIFTPRMELPFAGHPSVGAAWAAVRAGLARPRDGRLLQQCAAGLLPVTVGESAGQRRIGVRSPHAQPREAEAPPLPPSLARIAAPGHAPSLWNNGPDWWLLEVAGEASLRALQPELAAIAAEFPGGKLAAFAFSDHADYQLVVRAFAPDVGIAEDPVTGSANALIAAHLHRQGRLPGRDGHYVASQGRELGRDGKVEVRVDGEGEVWIGGLVQLVIEGTIDW